MSYRLDPSEDLDASFGMVAAAQAERLCQLLADPRELSTGHHKTRRCLKRLRSLFLLVPHKIGRRAWRRLDRRLAMIGRSLSGARDRAVLVDVLAKVTAGETDRTIRAAAPVLRQRLLRIGNGLVNGHSDDAMGGAQLRERLLRKGMGFARRMAKAPIKGLATSHILNGLQAEYRAGRSAVADAYRIGTDDAFHDLRKHVQRHARHMQLAHALWPQELAVRHDLAKELADQLGYDHDLALLRGVLKDLSGGGLKPADLRAVNKLCRERQRLLRREMQPQLERLYAERPRAFGRRLKGYWRTAVSPQAAEGTPAHPPSRPARAPVER
jgi:hypothetical protein